MLFSSTVKNIIQIFKIIKLIIKLHIYMEDHVDA